MSDKTPKPMTIDPVVLAGDAGDETLYFAGIDRQVGPLWTSVVTASYPLPWPRMMERLKERLADSGMDNLRVLRVDAEQTPLGLRVVRLLDDQAVSREALCEAVDDLRELRSKLPHTADHVALVPKSTAAIQRGTEAMEKHREAGS